MPRTIDADTDATVIVIPPIPPEDNDTGPIWNLTAQAIHDAARAEALAEVAAESVEQALEEIETAQSESDRQWTALQNDMESIRERLSVLETANNPPSLTGQENMRLTAEEEIAEAEAEAETIAEAPPKMTDMKETPEEDTNSIETGPVEESGEESRDQAAAPTSRKVKMY